jgi:hypothetical protein
LKRIGEALEPFPGTEVGAADAAAADLQEDLPFPGGRRLDGLDGEPMRFFENGGLHAPEASEKRAGAEKEEKKK